VSMVSAPPLPVHGCGLLLGPRRDVEEGERDGRRPAHPLSTRWGSRSRHVPRKFPSTGAGPRPCRKEKGHPTAPHRPAGWLRVVGYWTADRPGPALVLRFRNENQADFPFSRLFTEGQL